MYKQKNKFMIEERTITVKIMKTYREYEGD